MTQGSECEYCKHVAVLEVEPISETIKIINRSGFDIYFTFQLFPLLLKHDGFVIYGMDAVELPIVCGVRYFNKGASSIAEVVINATDTLYRVSFCPFHANENNRSYTDG